MVQTFLLLFLLLSYTRLTEYKYWSCISLKFTHIHAAIGPHSTHSQKDFNFTEKNTFFAKSFLEKNECLYELSSKFFFSFLHNFFTENTYIRGHDSVAKSQKHWKAPLPFFSVDMQLFLYSSAYGNSFFTEHWKHLKGGRRGVVHVK